MNYKRQLQNLLSNLSPKQQISFAYDCILDVKHLLIDSRSLKALEVTALYLEDKATRQELLDAADDASAANHHVYTVTFPTNTAVCHAASSVASVAHAAADTTYPTASSADYLVNYCFLCTSIALNIPANLYLKHYYTKLVNTLTEVEKAMYEL